MPARSSAARRVAILGGNRIPFARSNSVYGDASNQDMLTATLDGLAVRFGLEGERLGEVVAGAVLKHARDFNLARESVLGSRLSPETPATDIQQACGTGLQATIQVANKVALGQIDVGVAGGTDTTSDAPVAISDKLRKKLMKVNAARDTAGPAHRAGADPALGHRVVDPAERRAADASLDGGARRADGAGVEDLAGRPGRVGRGLSPAPRRGVRRRVPRRPAHAVPGSRARPEPPSRLLGREARHPQAGLRQGRGRHHDRRQLDTAHRRRVGGAALLGGVGQLPRPRTPRLPPRLRDRGGRLRARR